MHSKSAKKGTKRREYIYLPSQRLCVTKAVVVVFFFFFFFFFFFCGERERERERERAKGDAVLVVFSASTRWLWWKRTDSDTRRLCDTGLRTGEYSNPFFVVVVQKIAPIQNRASSSSSSKRTTKRRFFFFDQGRRRGERKRRFGSLGLGRKRKTKKERALVKSVSPKRHSEIGVPKITEKK
jgi:hypothetical protein